MEANREKFKQFVTEQLKDYDEWRESSPDGYAEIITDEAVKLFCQPAVVEQSEQLVCDICDGSGFRYSPYYAKEIVCDCKK